MLSLVAGLALVGIGVIFGLTGVVGMGPRELNVGGTVVSYNLSIGADSPVAGAIVTLNNVSRTSLGTEVTGPSGTFGFSNVPSGEHQLRVQYPGDRLSQMEIFLVPWFAAPSSNLSDLQVRLFAGNMSDVYDQPYAPYPDVETYVAYLFSASSIEVLGGLLAIWGGWSIREGKNAPRGVLGSAAGLLAPFLASVAGFQTLFLEVVPLTALIALSAVLLAGAALVMLVSTQRPLDGVNVPPSPPPA